MLFNKKLKGPSDAVKAIGGVLLVCVILAASEFIGFNSNTAKLPLLLVVAIISMWLFFDHKKMANNFAALTTILFPILIFGTVILWLTNPQKADILSIEDGPVENASAIFLFIATLFMAGVSYLRLKRGQWLVAGFALFGAALFFVIGMEEISWMQRVVNRESSELFLRFNSQNETNLHNMATGITEKSYYAGGFVLLTLLPLLRVWSLDFNKGSFLRKLEPLLPSVWLLVPFLSIAGLTGLYSFPMTSLFAIAIVVGVSVVAKNSDNVFVSLGVTVSLLAGLSAFVVVTFLNYETTNTRSWFNSEYREMFIALGVMIYAIDRYWAMYRKKEPFKINI